MLNKVRNIIHYRYTPAQLLNYLKYKTNRRKNTVLNYRPLWMLVYVTDLCNLHCKMCPHHTNADSSSFTQAKKLNADYISLETLEFSFKKFPESYFVMLAGVGEPLLHPQFKDIIRLCEKYKKKVKIVTNGIKLTTDMSDFLSLSKCIDEIQISLNAPDHITYFDICQGSEREYITVVNNIRGLVLAKAKNNSSVRISTSAVCGNEFKGKAYDFLCFADSLGVDRIELFRYIDFGIVGNNISDIKSDRDYIRELDKKAKGTIRAKYYLPHLVGDDTFESRCNWFWKNISIDSHGNIGSCGRVISPTNSYGNIFSDEDVWNNDYMQRMRQLFLVGSELPSSCCRACVENNCQEEKI